MRIIPKNTKVSTEFFSGVSLSDILVGFVGVVLLFFIIVSNLPYKLGICGGIAIVFAMLLVRIDDEPNYMFLFRIIKHLSYHKSFRKITDKYEDDEVEAEEDFYESEEAEQNEIMNEGVA